MSKAPTDLRLYLREWRELRGLTQSDLAEKMGFQPSYISLVENGKRSGVSFEFLTEAARALKCRAKDLFENPASDAIDLDLLAIIELWTHMPGTSRRAARAMLKGLAEEAEGDDSLGGEDAA